MCYMQNINWRLDDNKRVTQRPFWQLFQFLFFFLVMIFIRLKPVATGNIWLLLRRPNLHLRYI